MPSSEKPDEPPEDPEIDLRETPEQRFMGEPADCPACGGQGFLDMINLRREVQLEHCKTCGHRWSTPLAELIPRA